MKQSVRICALIVYLSAFVFPQAALPAVKVFLKNGREIVAESCTDSNNKLVCEKMGGYFEINKKDILETRGIDLEGSRSPAAAEAIEDGKAQDAVKEGKGGKEGKGAKDSGDVKEPVKPGAAARGAEKQPEGAVITGLNPEDGKRFDQITARKMELAGEREKLGKEREQLQKDVKDMGMVYSKEQLQTVNKRMAEIEERISKFNDEVKRLNDEEEKILGGLKKKQ